MFIEICPPNSTQHVVEEGDTLWKLSQAYDVNIQSIVDVNPGINPQNLRIGSTLCIPTAQTMPAPQITAAPLTSKILPATCPKGTLGYTIQSGDTLWKLSKAYDVDIQSILDVNPGINPQNLQIGSTLCIPTAQTMPAPSVNIAPPTKIAPLTPAAPLTSKILPATCPKGTLSYTIQSGDTLWKLSKAYDVDIQSILDVNPGINPQNLQIGSTLCIPTAQTMPAPSVNIAPPTKIAPQTMPAPSVNIAPPIKTAPQTMPAPSVNTTPPTMIAPQTMPAPSVNTIPPIKTAPQTMPAPLTPVAPLTSKILPAICPKGTLGYTIQSGDTLWKLSQAYGVDIQSIFDVNPGIDPQNLQTGSTLCIPTAQTMTAPSVNTATPTKTAPQTMPASLRHYAYCIKRCDTIFGIARNFYVSVESILNENPGINPKCLQVGTYIYVPVNCCEENSWRYTVMAGETLNGIANKLSVCPSVLIAANPNIDFQHLIHGQVICIPKE